MLREEFLQGQEYNWDTADNIQLFAMQGGPDVHNAYHDKGILK